MVFWNVVIWDVVVDIGQLYAGHWLESQRKRVKGKAMLFIGQS